MVNDFPNVAQEQSPETQVMQTVSPADRLGTVRTIYDAGPLEIFWKNFLAGFARSIGGAVIYIILFVISTYFFLQVVYPRIAPLLQASLSSMKTLQDLGSTLPATKQGATSQPVFNLGPLQQ